jgi:hypothetical protein
MGQIPRCLLGALAGYGIYLLLTWLYLAFMEAVHGGSPDTYLPFVWPLMSPFLIFRYSSQGTHLDENLLSLFGGLLLIAGALSGYLDFPRLKNRTKNEQRSDS